MDCIAHRGFAGEHPENTVRAFEEASRVADWVECDVRRCGSGEPVVVHDETVDRVTDASGPVEAFSRSELAAMDVLGSGEGIPALADVVAAVPSSVGIDVELKESGLAGDVASALAAHDGPVLLSAFDGADLAEATIVADLPLALLVERDPDEKLERARELGCTAVHPHWDLCDGSFVERAHDAGLAVNAWTIDERTAAYAARRAGVDGLIADSPEFCRP